MHLRQGTGVFLTSQYPTYSNLLETISPVGLALLFLSCSKLLCLSRWFPVGCLFTGFAGVLLVNFPKTTYYSYCTTYNYLVDTCVKLG